MTEPHALVQVSAREVHAHKVAELGLDPASLDLTSVEAIAGALRRAAGFFCPCSASTLVRFVTKPLRGLIEDSEAMRDRVEETLEAITAHGDLLESRELAESSGRGSATLLYIAPPRLITRQSGVVILLGITPGQISSLPSDLETRVEYVGYRRRLTPRPGEDLRAELIQLGFFETSSTNWLRAPKPEPPSQFLSRVQSLLDSAAPSRDVPGLSLLDPERPVRYYRGRWVEPRSQTGRFVARRSQAYGSDLWCYAQLKDGHPERLVDLPLPGSRGRGCDDAWRLQMAIDAIRGQPQRFRLRLGPDRTRIMEFFSPIPAWARRRWDAVAEPIPNVGCLVAYKLAEAELSEEIRFAREGLWLDELTESRRII